MIGAFIDAAEAMTGEINYIAGASDDNEAPRIAASAGLVAPIPCAVISSSYKQGEGEEYRSVVGRLGGGNFNISSFPRRAIDGGEEVCVIYCLCCCCCCCVGTGEDGIRSQVCMQKKRGEKSRLGRRGKWF